MGEGTCVCPVGYEGQPIILNKTRINDESMTGCKKRRTILGRECIDGDLCKADSERGYHWCVTRATDGDKTKGPDEEMTEDAKEEGEKHRQQQSQQEVKLKRENWDFCCSDAECRLNASTGRSGCWVDDAKTKWEECLNIEVKGEPSAVDVATILGPIFGIVIMFCICQCKAGKRK